VKIVIQSKPRTGETTLITEIINHLNINWVGFYTREIRKGKERTGFKIVDMNGEEKIFAHIDIKSTYRVGKYGVNIEVLEEVVDKIKKIQNPKIYIIDEIGKMELYSQKFKNFVTEVFNSSTPVVVTMKFQPDKFCNKLLTHPSCLIFNLEKGNYDQVKEEIITLISKSPTIQNS
jgi:nucleoside-triphosphatase